MNNAKNAPRAGIYTANALFCAFLLALILAPFSSVSIAQTSITGLWLYKIPTGDGNYRELFLDLKQDGEAVTGKVMFSLNRSTPISDGSVRGGKLHFVVKFGRPPRTREVTYDGTVKDGKLFLSSAFPGRPTLQRCRGAHHREGLTAPCPSSPARAARRAR